MNVTFVTIPAHFDGVQIRLDAEIELKPDTRLLVTILDQDTANGMLVRGAMRQAEASFAQVWDNEEDAAYDTL